MCKFECKCDNTDENEDTYSYRSCFFGYAFAFLVSISMIIVGASYLSNVHCPSENIAPLLILGGFFSMIGTIATCIAFCTTDEDENCIFLAYRIFSRLFYLAYLCIFIAICVFVFRLYPKVEYEDPESQFYCHKGLFVYSFIYLMVIMAFLTILIGFCCYNACANLLIN